MENNENFEVKVQRERVPFYKKWWFWVIIGVLAIALIIGSSSGDSDNSIDQNSDVTASSGNNSDSGSDNNNTNKATVGESNALRSAKNYLRTMPFSKEGLKEQLEFEGYTESEAVYGVNNCGANWKEQAVKAAKNYLKAMPFSRQELIDQLEFEGYTTEEAIYGVDQAYK